jgi:hypothetical protein
LGHRSRRPFILLALVVFAAPNPAAAIESIRVDLRTPGRPARRAGAGLNWGVTRILPDDATLAQLRPLVVRQPASLDGEHGDLGALDVLPRARAAGIHHVEAELRELLPGYPPSWLGLDEWRQRVTAFVARKVDEADDDVWYEPWSEPDRDPPPAWDHMGGYPAFWKLTFDQLREADAAAVVVGPGWSGWSREAFQDTLGWMRDSNALPDVLSWSEKGSPTEIEAHVADCRALLGAMGIEERPIALAEYASPAQKLTPGALVRYLAAIERARVAYASLAAAGGDLGSTSRLLVGDTPRAAFWAWRWYVTMRGEISVTVPTESGGVAIVDVEPDAAQIRILVAGGQASLSLTGIAGIMGPAVGNLVHTRVELAPDIEEPLRTPQILVDGDRALSAGALVVDIPQDQAGAALVTLTPSALRASRRRPY